MKISSTDRISFKSLTGIVLILGFCISVLSVRSGWHDWADSQMFSFGAHLLPDPEPVNNIELIGLPETVMTDPESLTQLNWLINKLRKSNVAAIGLFLEQLPSLDFSRTEKNSKKQQADENDWQPSNSQLSQLAQTLNSKQVQMGIAVGAQKNFYSVGNLKAEQLDKKGLIEPLTAWLLPQSASLSIFSLDDNYPYQRLPYKAEQVTARQPLIWHEKDSDIYLPDLSLGLYASYKRVRKPSWQNDGSIHVNSKVINTDVSGHVMMYYSEYTGNTFEKSFIPVADALKASKDTFRKNLVLIGRADDPQVITVANNLASLISQSVYYSPVWSYWLNAALLVVILFYLMKVAPGMGTTTAVVVSLLLLTFVLVMHYGFLVIKGMWMPFISIYIYLVAGHIIVLLKQQNDSVVNHVRLQAHEALWHLGQYQFEKGDHDKAATSLLKCKPTADVLEKMYEIGLGYERHREYDKALQLYSEINIRHKGYRDVNKRLESLTNVTGVATEILTPGSATKTLVMPDMGLQLPVLGRYELEKELGRGAMGVVYLGKDPKINRKVAIKTLDYNMFTEAEIKTIKSRFFREAEAAGRLSHPNIVTVYDVGDEKDFAFIAMDYAQGVPLSDYTDKKKLLPVEEVYQIIAEVAETLDYAHSKNIVHRDIKPSNIMYDRKTGQIKITDFGIARITDSAKTRTGSFMGSPAYMAPEQMTGSKVDGHADIYSLGTSLYQLLTGELPFKADSLASLAYQINHDKHIPIRNIRSDLPASATRIVNKALQKKPSNRFDNGKEMAEALRKGIPKGN